MKTLLNILPIEFVGWWMGCGRMARAHATSTASGNRRDVSLQVAVIVLLTSFAAAQTLTGTVKNSTTGRPSAGDEVVLFKLGQQGMEETGRTQTNAAGYFSLKLDDPQAPHLVRAVHQGVAYHRVASPGTTSVAVDVYDVAKKIEGIGVAADIMRIQAAQGQILVTREIGVRNTSNPPRTQMNERNCEFYVPDNARIIDASATTVSGFGAPVKASPQPEKEKNRYALDFPLRPGMTRFEVTYQLPYSGSVDLDPKSIYPLEYFLVVLPKSMQFKAAASAATFKVINLPNQPDANVEVASNTRSGQDLAFRLSGEGELETGLQNATNDIRQNGQSTAAAASGAQFDNRPGGGLGRLIAARDPLQKYWWWILASSAAVLIMGGVYVASRQQRARRALSHKEDISILASAVNGKGDGQPSDASFAEAARAPSSGLMQGIKDKLFQIEVEHKTGHLSQAEYEMLKALLDKRLNRALRREAQEA